MANDLDQSVSNAIAGGVSAPVDLIAWALRKAGVPGVEKPVMGSDWMREKGTAPVKSQGAAIVGETAGNLLDPLSALGAGAKAAILIPALRSRGWDLEDAVKAVKSGATHSELWDKFKLFSYPGQIKKDFNLDKRQAVFGSEIDNGYLAPIEVMRDAEHSLPTILDNQALYDEIPRLADVRVKMAGYPGSTNTQGTYAHTKGPAGTIFVNPDTSVNQRATFWHELNHAVNAHSDQLGTLGSQAPFDMLNPGMRGQILDMVQILRGTGDHDLANKVRMVDDALAQKNVWGHSSGERLAEADSTRSMNPLLKQLPPIQHMNSGNWPMMHGGESIPDDVARHLEHALLIHDGDPYNAVDYLRRQITP